MDGIEVLTYLVGPTGIVTVVLSLFINLYYKHHATKVVRGKRERVNIKTVSETLSKLDKKMDKVLLNDERQDSKLNNLSDKLNNYIEYSDREFKLIHKELNGKC